MCFYPANSDSGPTMTATSGDPLEKLRYIAVEGPIGVGKSSLVRALVDRLGGRPLFEAVEENPFLKSFYADRTKHAFQTQLFFLLSRYKQQQELFQDDLFNQTLVSDYLFAKDRIFATATLDPNELALYERIFESLRPRIRTPDLVVYLRSRHDVLMSRIRKRGRDFERRFDGEYLEELCGIYNDYFFHYTESPLLVVDTSEMDFVANEADLNDILGAMRRARKGTTYIQRAG